MTPALCVFVGVSVDGRIARPDGDIEWLTSRGAVAGDVGYDRFVATVDALLMGRATYEVVAGFGGPWPYGSTPVHVLSTTLAPDVDERLAGVHATYGDAIAALEAAGAQRVYVDGGRTIQTALRAGHVVELTLSSVAVLVGDGAPLFGPLDADIDLEHVSTEVLGGGMVQTTYRVA